MAAPFQASWMKTPVERVAEQAAMQAPTTIPNQPGGQKFDPFVPNAGTWEEFQQPGQIQEQPNNPNINKGRPSETNALGQQFDNFFKWGEEKTGRDNFIESPYKNSTMASNPETIEEKAQQNKDTVKESSPWPSQQRPLEAIQKQSKEEKIDKPAELPEEREGTFLTYLGSPFGLGKDATKPLPKGQIGRKDTQEKDSGFMDLSHTLDKSPSELNEISRSVGGGGVVPSAYYGASPKDLKKVGQDVIAVQNMLADQRAWRARDNAKYGIQVGDKFIGEDELKAAPKSAEAWTLPNGVSVSNDEIRNQLSISADGQTAWLPSTEYFPLEWLDSAKADVYYEVADGIKLPEKDVTYEINGGNAKRVQDPETYGPLNMLKVETGDLWKGEDIAPIMTDGLLTTLPYVQKGKAGNFLRGLFGAANFDAALNNVNPREMDYFSYGHPDQELKNSQKMGNAIAAPAEPLTEKIGGIAGTKSKYMPWKEAKTIPGRIGQDVVQEGFEEQLMVPIDQLAQDGFLDYGANRVWNPNTREYEYENSSLDARMANLGSNSANAIIAGGLLGGAFSSAGEASKYLKDYQKVAKGKTYNHPELPYDNANLQAEKEKLINKKLNTLTKEGGE